MKAVLVIEDLPDIRSWLVDTVRVAFPDAEVTAIGRCGDGIDALARQPFDVVLTDLELPDGSGVSVIRALRQQQPMALSVVVTIHDDDEHLFPALQAGAFGYLLKEASRQELVAQLQRIADGEPPLSPPIARRMLAYFSQGGPRVVDVTRFDPHEVALNGRETDLLQRVAKCYTLPEIAGQLNLSRHTLADYVKQIYRKLNVSSRTEAALEAARRGLVRP